MSRTLSLHRMSDTIFHNNYDIANFVVRLFFVMFYCYHVVIISSLIVCIQMCTERMIVKINSNDFSSKKNGSGYIVVQILIV